MTTENRKAIILSNKTKTKTKAKARISDDMPRLFVYAKHDREDTMAGKNYIITIQRQFGSLGRPIAQKMAELLNIKYYDRDILDLASKEMKLAKSAIKDYDETSYARMKHPLGLGNTKMQDYLFSVQQCIISEIATKEESCIIVGRCSDYILRHLDNTFNIFIYAPYEARLDNCVNVLGFDAAEARTMIKQVDKARKNYHKYYTGEAPDTISNRQILIDSSMYGVDGTAEILVDMVKKKFGLTDIEK